MCKKTIYLILLVALFAGSAQAQFITGVAMRNGSDPPQIAPDPLAENSVTFVDRTHVYADIPESILGAQYVMLANDDKGISAYELDLTFAISATLYYFVDNRMGSSDGGKDVDPDISGMGWLTDMGFVDTGEDIGIDESFDGGINQYYSIFFLGVEAGTVTIFGNTEGHGGNMFGVAALGPKLSAYNPVPEDGAIYPQTWVSLAWTPGDTAVTHDIYLSDNFEDVNDGTGDSFRINQSGAYFVAGFVGYPYPNGLVNGTTYYWRIDEVETDGITIHRGNVWSFTVPSKQAYDPVPSNGAKFIDTEGVNLTWTPGFEAKLHTVYFSENFDDVNDGVGGTQTPIANFATGPLEVEKTYYWRVDEFDALTTNRGDVWSFITAKVGGGVRGDYYTGMNFENLVLTRTDPQVDFSWGNPGGPDPAVGDDNFSARWTGEVEAAFTETYTFYTRTDDGARLWVDGKQLVDDWNNHGAIENGGQIDLVAGNTYGIVMEYYEDGGGAVAELRWSSSSTSKDFIPQAALATPVKASSPSPSNGATGTKMTPILRWGVGDFAASHEVYFGTDANAVKNATTASPEYIGPRALGDESYNPGKLAWATSYFWRIDEVNALNPDSPWVGNLWSFTTGDFLVVDNFEDYDAGDNQIWFAWHDGLGYGVPGIGDYFAGNGTGGAVGDETTASYTEETIVHGGRQSMPLYFNNNKQGYANYSEAELTLTDSRDWTEEGVAELSIWFRGNPVSVGSFVESPIGTYTMTASGADIFNEADEFHFAYKTLTGAGTIIARVESVELANNWSKAGVMVRETLGAGSKFAAVYITPTNADGTATNGCRFQARLETDVAAVSDSSIATAEQMAVIAPFWIKMERDVAGNFRASFSADGFTWRQMAWNPQSIPMSSNVYVGLALTSHDAALTCEGVFSNVTITGNVAGQWAHQDIGIESNRIKHCRTTCGSGPRRPGRGNSRDMDRVGYPAPGFCRSGHQPGKR